MIGRALSYRRYKKLRRALLGKGYVQGELGEYLTGHPKATYLSMRFSDHRPWRQDHMYEIMDLLQEPYSRITEFFPPHGIEIVKKQEPRRITDRNHLSLIG